MTFTDFCSYSFPETSVFERQRFDSSTNLIKWFAIRFAYVLFRMNMSANLLNVMSLFSTYLGFILLYNARSGNLIVFVCGLGLLYLQIFIDFVDGPIAKAKGTTSPIGHALDNLGCDVTRVVFLVLIGMYSKSTYLLLANPFSAIILLFLVPQTLEKLPEQGLARIVVKVVTGKFSLIGVRVNLVLLPLAFGFVILDETNLIILSRLFSYIYLSMAIAWLIVCLPHYRHPNTSDL